MVEPQPEHRVADVEHRVVGGHVGLRAGVRLDVGVLGAEEGLGALDGDALDLVDDLAAAVVALARVALGVLVGEHRADGLHDRRPGEVLRRDELELVALAVGLAPHQLGDRGVDRLEPGAPERREGVLGRGHGGESIRARSALRAAWVAWSRPMLELDRLTRRFGATVALDGLSFTVPTGTIFGFVGPNGAGKTTAMRIVLGRARGGRAARRAGTGRPIDAETRAALRLHAGGARPLPEDARPPPARLPRAAARAARGRGAARRPTPCSSELGLAERARRPGRGAVAGQPAARPARGRARARARAARARRAVQRARPRRRRRPGRACCASAPRRARPSSSPATSSSSWSGSAPRSRSSATGGWSPRAGSTSSRPATGGAATGCASRAHRPAGPTARARRARRGGARRRAGGGARGRRRRPGAARRGPGRRPRRRLRPVRPRAGRRLPRGRRGRDVAATRSLLVARREFGERVRERSFLVSTLVTLLILARDPRHPDGARPRRRRAAARRPRRRRARPTSRAALEGARRSPTSPSASSSCRTARPRSARSTTGTSTPWSSTGGASWSRTSWRTTSGCSCRAPRPPVRAQRRARRRRARPGAGGAGAGPAAAAGRRRLGRRRVRRRAQRAGLRRRAAALRAAARLRLLGRRRRRRGEGEPRSSRSCSRPIRPRAAAGRQGARHRRARARCSCFGIGVLASGAGIAVGAIEVPSDAIVVRGDRAGWFLLGYAFFACAYAAAGALVPRQEDLQNTTTPLSLVLIASFLLSFAAIENPDGGLARVLSLVPPISAMVMPPRMAAGDVPILDVILSVSLMLLATAILIPVAARLYEGVDPAPGPAGARARRVGQPARRAGPGAGRLTRATAARSGAGSRRGRSGPSRRMAGSGPVTSTTVDARPPAAPPSTATSTSREQRGSTSSQPVAAPAPGAVGRRRQHGPGRVDRRGEARVEVGHAHADALRRVAAQPARSAGPGSAASSVTGPGSSCSTRAAAGGGELRQDRGEHASHAAADDRRRLGEVAPLQRDSRAQPSAWWAPVAIRRRCPSGRSSGGRRGTPRTSGPRSSSRVSVRVMASPGRRA